MLKIGEKIFENLKFRVNYSTMKTKTVEIKKVKFSHRLPHKKGQLLRTLKNKIKLLQGL